MTNLELWDKVRRVSPWKLANLLEYDCLAGSFVWKRSRPGISVGSLAGSTNSEGYRVIKIEGDAHKAHRLAYAMHYGFFPHDRIDHINGNRSDNRISNLRVTTNRENCQNRESHRSGKLAGCYFNKDRGLWQAQIQIDGRQIYLGRFETEAEAHEAYKGAA